MVGEREGGREGGRDRGRGRVGRAKGERKKAVGPCVRGQGVGSGTKAPAYWLPYATVTILQVPLRMGGFSLWSPSVTAGHLSQGVRQECR